jgi:hypothetical protein
VAAVGDEALRFVRDSFYVAVGFGVLTFQRLQVQRRELEKSLDRRLSAVRQPVDRIVGRGGGDGPSS